MNHYFRLNMNKFLLLQNRVYILLHHQQEFFSRFGKNLIFLPDHIHFNLNGRIKGAETEFAVTGSIDDSVIADCVSQSLFHKKRDIEQQIVSHNNIQFVSAKQLI